MTWGMVAVAGATLVGGEMASKGAGDAADKAAAGAQSGIDAELQMFREGQEATAPWRAAGEQALGALSSVYGLGGYSTQESAADSARYNELMDLTSGGRPELDANALFRGEEGAIGIGEMKGLQSQYDLDIKELEGLETGVSSMAAATEPDPYASFFGMQDRLREGFETSPGQEFQLAEAEKAAKRQLSAGGFSGSGAEMKELQRLAQGQASQEWGSYLGQFGDYTNALRSMAGQGQTSAGQTAAMSAGVGSNIAGSYSDMGRIAAQNDITQANIAGNVIGQGAQAFGAYQGMNRPETNTQLAGSPYGLQSGYSYA